MLPRKIPKPAKRASRWRSASHCNFVRSHECIVPGCGGRPIEVMHVRKGSGAGAGQKPDDWNTVSGCQRHHAEQHQIGEDSFEDRYLVKLSDLAAEFAANSPKAHEINRVKREREHS